jgi:hypothetical protein
MTYFVSLDWAAHEDAVCVVDERTAVVTQFTVAHTASGMAELASRLGKLAPPPGLRLVPGQRPSRRCGPNADEPARPNAIRMGTDDAKQTYKQRVATAETVNADARAHRGRATTALRGLRKVTGSATSCASSPCAATSRSPRPIALRRVRSLPTRAGLPHFIPGSRTTTLGPARSQPTRGRRLIDVAPTARLRSCPARRTVPTL